MEEIKIQVTNKVATAIGTPTIICGNSDYALKFTFDKEWDNHLTKTARFTFFKDGIYKYIEVEFVGGTCYAPILTDIDKVTVGVYAGELQTTTGADIRCKRSILCGVQTPETNVNGKVVSLNSAIEHFAPAIKGKGKAECVVLSNYRNYLGLTIRDISPLKHTVSLNFSNELGNPVRGMEVTVRGKNLARFEQGSVDTTSGENIEKLDCVRTQYIPVIEGNTYSVNISDNQWTVAYAFAYDKYKRLIKSCNVPYPVPDANYIDTGKMFVTIPTGMSIAYVRVVFQHRGTAIRYTKNPPTANKIITSEWNEFIPFVEDANTSYSMLYDDENLYLAIKTSDTVINNGSWGGEGQLGIFINYPNRAYYKSARVQDANATPNGVALVYYGNTAKDTFVLGKETYGNLVTPISKAGNNYQFVMSRDENNCIQFFIKMNWKGFLGISDFMKCGSEFHFGAMYETMHQRSYTELWGGDNHYSAFEKFWIYTNESEMLNNTPIVVEVGDTPTEYEPCVEPKTYYVDETNTIEGVESIYPTMIIESSDIDNLYAGTTVTCEYNKDTTKVIEELRQAIISLGGNV